MADDSRAYPARGESSGPSTDRDNTPVIDPTKNVSDQLRAAIERQDDLRHLGNEIVRLRTGHVEELSSLRAEERDIAVHHVKDLFLVELRVRDAEIGGLRALHEEMLKGVREINEVKFADSKIAVDAAFAAAKEAVAENNKSSSEAALKQEAAFTKQIDQLSTLFATTISGLATQITDLKDAVNQRNGRGAGLQQGWGILVAVVGMVGVLVTIAILVAKSIP